MNPNIQFTSNSPRIKIAKYIPFGKMRYRPNRTAEPVHQWRGPRCKQLVGTGKALARLDWDKARNA